MKKLLRVITVSVMVFGSLLALSGPAVALKDNPLKEAINPILFDAMKYRFIGPYRGGRVVAVAGVPGNPNLYYMGATGGGVFKTIPAHLF